MATPEILDFEQLLKPISDEAPAGPELKDPENPEPALATVYHNAKDARDAARTAERQIRDYRMMSEEDRERPEAVQPDSPDWKKVNDLTSQAITEHSKDLWLAAWLIEALCRLHGFAGLRDGFRLARELSERFWDGIHPRPDEDGYATTVAQLTGLNGDESEGALIAPISELPITADGSFGPLTSADYRDAADLEQSSDPDRRAQRIEAGAVTLQMLDKAVRESPPDFFRELLEDIEQCLDEFNRLNTILEEKCGQGPDGYPAAPPSSAIRGALEGCRDRVRSLARSVLEIEGEDGESEQAGGLVEVDGSGVPATKKGGMSREDAFRALLQVADYFRRAEPHSPVSYALEQAVRWGRMSLPELMTELISDSSAREELFRRTGIPKPSSED